MTDPDKSSASTSFVYGSTIALAVAIVVMIIVLYDQLDASSTLFKLILWLGLPVAVFIIGTGMNMIGQNIACKSVNVGKAAIASATIFPTLYGSLGIAQISHFRAPIISLFSQDPLLNVLSVEEKNPAYKGIAVAYYAFFGILYGQIISSGYSQVC